MKLKRWLFFIKIFYFLFILGGIFYFRMPVLAVNHLLINEIFSQGKNDWIELYNPLEEDIDLKEEGYRLEKTKTAENPSIMIRIGNEDDGYYPNGTIIPAHGFYLIVRDDADEELLSQADAVVKRKEFTWENDGYTFYLGNKAISSDDDPDIIDKVGFGEAKYFEGKGPAPAIPENQSIERSPIGEDSDDNQVDFQINPQPSPQNSKNKFSSRPTERKSIPTEQKKEKNYQPGDVVINELVSDPTDEETEWIELFNKTDEEISLDDWTIEDNREKPVNLESLTIEPFGYLVLIKGKHFTFSLNNEGDILILKFQNKIIDKVAYGSFDDGNKEDNAPRASDPFSLARFPNGQDTDNDKQDFSLSDEPTKGEANLIPFEEKEVIFSKDICLNEILPNPFGSDEKNEFIELKNNGDEDVDLAGWSLEDAVSRKYVIDKNDFDSTFIPAKGFFIVPRQISKIALNNFGQEVLKLNSPQDELVEKAVYNGSVEEGQAYARDEKGVWKWTIKPTPGKDNFIQQPNHSPQPVIYAPATAKVGEEILFDASDSYDLDGDNLSYLWRFPSGLTDERVLTKYTFKESGEYKVVLRVSDDKGLSKETKILIKVSPSNSQTTQTESEEGEEEKIVINEILPNPKGADKEEWIEIYNASDHKINLTNWKIDDKEGESKPYQIPEGIFIEPGQFLVFEKEKTKITLNNQGEIIRLFDNQGKMRDEVSYNFAKEGFSYNRDDSGHWYWSDEPTPGRENIFSLKEIEGKNRDFENEFSFLSLDEIKKGESGLKIETKGIVLVEPGVLGSQIFYIGQPGIQIFMYKKDFPPMKQGDYLKIKGILSESRGEKRIKVSKKEDIAFLKHQEPVKPVSYKIADLENDNLGSLVSVEGELVSQKGRSFYLDDGTEQIKVYLKSSVSPVLPQFYKGDKMKVSGIFSQTKNGYQILPRGLDDVKKLSSVGNFDNLSGDISKTIEVPQRYEAETLLKYLAVSIIALLIILIGLILRTNKIKDKNN